MSVLYREVTVSAVKGSNFVSVVKGSNYVSAVKGGNYVRICTS